jgi:hypothetical protein
MKLRSCVHKSYSLGEGEGEVAIAIAAQSSLGSLSMPNVDLPDESTPSWSSHFEELISGGVVLLVFVEAERTPAELFLRMTRDIVPPFYEITLSTFAMLADRGSTLDFVAQRPAEKERIREAVAVMIFALDVSTMTSQRICDAGEAEARPPLIAEVLRMPGVKQGSDPALHRIFAAAGQDAQVGTFRRFLSERRMVDSQRAAVFAVLDAPSARGHRCQLIQGPPGTGKTSTLVPLLRVMLALDERTLCAAPSNVAVCELAARTIKDVDSQSPAVLPRPPLSSMLLVGSATVRSTPIKLTQPLPTH